MSVTHTGQRSRPPSTAPSSHESSSSKSAGAAIALVSNALLAPSTSMLSIPFSPFSPAGASYATARVRGTFVSHSAARAATKSASTALPASARMCASIRASHARRPGTMDSAGGGGRKDGCARVVCSRVERSCARSSNALLFKCG